ncbi:MAG: FadR/GntR family transcriptional regulator [Candidatus Dormibacteria bacterium]
MAAEVTPRARLGTKEELRQGFGVSMATFNQAVRLLESQGIVELRTGPKGGVFRAAPSGRLRLTNLILELRDDPQVVQECLEVREILEPFVAREAARRRRAPDVRALRKLIAEMGQHLDEPRVYLELNWKLHEQISLIAANRVLQGVYGSLLQCVEEEVLQVAPSLDFGHESAGNLHLHSELVEAIASGDEERAASLAQHHAPVKDLRGSGPQ